MDNNTVFDLDTLKLPYSVEAEQSVLGAIIIDPPSIQQILGMITPDYFYVPQHQEIFKTLSNMFELSRTIDFVTLLEKLKDEGVYDEAGGKAYIKQLAQVVPSSANIINYAAIIRDRYYTRTLINAAQAIIKDATENVLDANKLLDNAEQRIYEIRQGRDVEGLVHIKDVIAGETYDRLTKLADPETRDDYVGIPTGMGDLDKLITGLNKSDLIILGARPAMGKTSFALNIAKNVAVKSKKTVCFFSLEMSRDQLAQRLLSSEAMVDSTKLRTGDLTSEEWARIGNAGAVLSAADIYVDETSGITVPEMKAKLMRMKKPADLVVIDYLGLMQSAKRSENRVQEISDITRNLKCMAKDLKIPVLVCAQLSRATEAKGKSHRPGLADLRESGSIEQDADIVMFLYREKYYDNEKKEDEERADEHTTECIVAKNRHGAAETVKLHWDGQFTRFSSVDNFR
ncbi:MAG: replicative DNA helicase [Clostridiales bacterium]|nr:replicative DNA helicase [Candidatus Equinaster intestinalis]